MSTAARRLTGIGAVWTVLIGTACFDVSSMLAPGEASKSASGRDRQFRGELSASFQAGGVGYESNRIPFVALLKKNRAEISAQSARSMLATIKRVPAPNKSLSAPASPSLTYISDPAWQVYYDTGVANMSNEAPAQDLYLTTSEMDALTGTTVFAEDLAGDGSAISQIIIQRGAGSPEVTTTVTLNGQVMHTSTIEYQSTEGGYSRAEHSTASYDRYGSTTTSGTVRSGHNVEYTSRPDVARVHYAAAAIANVWAGLPQLLAPLAPAVAYAQSGCDRPRYWKTRMIIFGSVMVASGLTGQWYAYGAAMLAYESSLNGYMACRAAQ